jgi:hypothetical protein
VRGQQIGSGASKKDLVDCEDKEKEREEPSMVTITLHCPHCGS